MAEPTIKSEDAEMPESAAFVTLYMDASGGLRMSSKGVGAYTLVGWLRTTLKKLENQLIAGKP